MYGSYPTLIIKHSWDFGSSVDQKFKHMDDDETFGSIVNLLPFSSVHPAKITSYRLDSEICCFSLTPGTKWQIG